MSVSSGTVVQYSLDGSQLQFTDTGSYTPPIASRVLTMYDPLGNVLQTFNMGTSLTQIITISADGGYRFILAVTDSTGVVTPITIDYVAAGFYVAAYLNQFASTNCGCEFNNCNMETAELFYNAALRFNLAGNLAAADANIKAANVFINMSPVVQYA